MRRTLSRHLQRQWWRPRLSPTTAALLPLSWLVALVAAARRAAARRTRSTLAVPAIVVGNVIVGGAGKTPTVIALVRALQAWGYRPGIVSRGQGRRDDAPALLRASPGELADPRQFGDEPVLMQARTGVPVAVGRRRLDAAQALLRAHPELDVIVSDDGLQHAALPRDIELVVFDGRGIGNGHVLPAGPLRERIGDVWPARGEAAAPTHEALVFMDAGVSRFGVLNGQWPPAPARALPASVPRLVPASSRLAGVVDLASWSAGRPAEPASLERLRGRTMLAAAGIGEPERFFAMLEAEGMSIRRLALPDHAPLDPLPWDAGVDEVVVTEKDAVKLAGRVPPRTQVWVATLDFRLPEALLVAVRAALVAAAARADADSIASP